MLRQPGKENAWFLPTHNPTATPRMKPRPAGWGRGLSGPLGGPNQSPFIQVISCPLLSTYCVPPAWKSRASGGGVWGGGRAASVWPAPPPAPQRRRRGSLHALPSVSTSANICFFSGWGWGEKRRKQARGGYQGLPLLLSTRARPWVIECSFPVAGPAQRGPFMASPWLPGNQATASAPRPLNSSSKPLHQQLPGPGEGGEGRLQAQSE